MGAKAKDLGGGHLEERALFPRGSDHSIWSRCEEYLGFEQANLPDVIVDLVVGSQRQEAIAERDTLASVSDAERTEREGRDYALRPEPIRERKTKPTGVVSFERIFLEVDARVGIVAEDLAGDDLGESERRNLGRFGERSKRREEYERPLHRRLVLEELLPRGVDKGGVEHVGRSFFIDPEEPKKCDVASRRATFECPTCRQFTERDRQFNGPRLDVG